MRTIRELIGTEDKVFILLKSKPIRYRFMSDAALEGITYGDGVPATDREVEDIMALRSDGTICFLGWAGHMCYHHSEGSVLRVDYERYISGDPDYIIRKRG